MDVDIIELKYKPTIWGKERTVKVTSDFIVIEKDSGKKVQINLREFEGFKFGIFWAHFWIPLGINFYLQIKGSNKNNLKISMFSLFGIGGDQSLDWFNELYDAIDEKLVRPKCVEYIEQILEGETIHINNVSFDKYQITIKESKRNIKSYFLTDIEILEYQSYFTIVHTPTNAPLLDLRYREDWNAAMVFTMLDVMTNS